MVQLRFGVLFVLLLLQTICSIELARNHNKMPMEEFGIQLPPLTSTGTTIVGICCRDGVVLGADTRATGGMIVMNKDKRKISRLAPLIYCCGAGTAADCDQIVRRTQTQLLRQRILSEDQQAEYMDPIVSALKYITNISTSPTLAHRMPSAAFIVGGIDAAGPALYSIDNDGVPHRARFTALGSGSMDAVAVLESIRTKHWGPYRTSRWFKSARSGQNIEQQNASTSLLDDLDTITIENHPYFENISVVEAVGAVRRAVRAGILNDLGSGSHVDVCVISLDGTVRLWRDTMKSEWEDERKQRNTEFLEKIVAANATAGADASDEGGRGLAKVGRLLWKEQPENESNLEISLQGQPVETSEFFQDGDNFVSIDVV